MKLFNIVLPLLIMTGLTQYTFAEPTLGETTVLGPFAGMGAKFHPDNISPHQIKFSGTDLGWTYEHKGQLHVLFGDSFADEKMTSIESSTGELQNDGFGTIDLSEWPDPDKITSDNIPLLKLGQHPGTSEMIAINPGHVMDGLKTPEAGWSNGEREFAILIIAKSQACKADDDCESGLTCDNEMGFTGTRYTDQVGLTFGCFEGTPGCSNDTMINNDGTPVKDSGLCIDETSSIWADTQAGRIGAVAFKQRVSLRDENEPGKYTGLDDWLTNKFINTTVSTVESFIPQNGPGHKNQNYSIAQGADGNQRVFLWGRPGFVGVKAKERTMDMYFAYADMPKAPDFNWKVNYFTGTDESGTPQFSPNENEAVALDQDSSKEGIQATEPYDIVQHMSIVWIEHLKKWVMFYGGGVTNLPVPELGYNKCGILEAFVVGGECVLIDMDNGAIRMRTADNPWGPWTPSEDVIVGGDPAVPGSGQYGPGGILRHPACKEENCAPHNEDYFFKENEYGWLYGANIVEQWIKPVGESVDVIWLASTWDPYRVVMLRTRINP